MEVDDSEPMELTDSCQPRSPVPTPPRMHITLKLGEDGEPILLSYKPLLSPYCHQITPEEYREQAVSYTKQALQELQASPEYRRHVERCRSCSAVWFDGQWTQGCKECGGDAMMKLCPICKGLCGRQWKKDVDMSHRWNVAHWDGECGHKDAAAKLKQLLYMHSITDAMEQLQT